MAHHPCLGRLIGAFHPSAATSVEEARTVPRGRGIALLFTLAFGRGGIPSDTSSSSFTLSALHFFVERFGARFTSAFEPNTVRRKLLSSLILVTRDGLEATELFREREGAAETSHDDAASSVPASAEAFGWISPVETTGAEGSAGASCSGPGSAGAVGTLAAGAADTSPTGGTEHS